MTRVTTIINQKGGVGKTTTAHALATGLTKRGLRVLVIDADPQGNISYAMRANTQQNGLYEAMRGVFSGIVQKTAQGDIVSSSLNLAGADMEFTSPGREYLIREMLEALPEKYDHVIIDSPPALGILTVNALTAANDIVIPVGADIFSLQGLQQLLVTVSKVTKYSNAGLKIAGILITRKGNKAIATRQLIEAIEAQTEALGIPLYRSVIREGVAIREAQIMQESLFDAAPKAKVTEDYSSFIDEYLKGVKADG